MNVPIRVSVRACRRCKEMPWETPFRALKILISRLSARYLTFSNELRDLLQRENSPDGSMMAAPLGRLCKRNKTAIQQEETSDVTENDHVAACTPALREHWVGMLTENACSGAPSGNQSSERCEPRKKETKPHSYLSFRACWLHGLLYMSDRP